MVTKIINAFQKLRYKKSFKKAVKHANHVRYTTGLKCFVLLMPKGYKAYTKQALKQLVRQHYFKKGTTIQTLESMAVYVTS